jgi:hypothetical protein
MLRKVRFHNGFFQLKLDAVKQSHHQACPADGWAPIVPLRGRATYDQILDAYGKEAAEAFTTCTFEEVGVNRLAHLSDEQAVSLDGYLLGAGFNARAVAENHTGKHHRNKTVSVPTAAGEPVRG